MESWSRAQVKSARELMTRIVLAGVSRVAVAPRLIAAMGSGIQANRAIKLTMPTVRGFAKLIVIARAHVAIITGMTWAAGIMSQRMTVCHPVGFGSKANAQTSIAANVFPIALAVCAGAMDVAVAAALARTETPATAFGPAMKSRGNA